MYPAVPTWCLIVLAVAALVVRRWPCLLQLFGAKYFRVIVLGEPGDVAPRETGSRYAEYHSQLIDLGFEPLGVFRESLPGNRGEKEYVFVHAGLGCRANIYTLRGGLPRVCLKSDMADGRLVATFNYGGEELEQDTADYICWHHPTHSMEELLEVHEDARFSWLSEGANLVAPRSIEEGADLETRNFFNSSVHRGFRRLLIEVMLWGLPVVAVVSAGAAWVLPGGFWRPFSLCVIASTAVGYLLEKWCERGAVLDVDDGRIVAPVPAGEAAAA